MKYRKAIFAIAAMGAVVLHAAQTCFGVCFQEPKLIPATTA